MKLLSQFSIINRVEQMKMGFALQQISSNTCSFFVSVKNVRCVASNICLIQSKSNFFYNKFYLMYNEFREQFTI